METRGHGLYNLIRMNWLEDPNLPVDPWQVEDYRSLPEEVIYSRLETLGISLDRPRFLEYALHFTSPEEMTETLWVDEELEHFDKAYLLLFELWRRFLPEKQSLSIFCDELDALIDRYDENDLQDETILQDALIDLERVVDQHADQGGDPKQVFAEISLYCAHDLESFIYDYASEEIDRGNFLAASEIIDAFFPYIANTIWFEFLQLRLLAPSDPEEAEIAVERIVEDPELQEDFELLLEISRYLVHESSTKFFAKIVKQAKPLIQTEQDFQELLAITSEFFRLLDEEEKAERLTEILKKRQDQPLEKEISATDKDMDAFFRLLSDLDRSKA